MAYTIDPYDTNLVGNLINHTVITHAYAPVSFTPGQFTATRRARISGKSLDCGDNAVVDFRRKP